MELLTLLNNTTTLSNKELADNFNKINSAMTIGNSAKWDLTKAWNTILVNKLYEDDFRTTNKKGEDVPMSESQLATEIGVSKGIFAQYKGACRLLNICDRFNEDNITMYKAYMLSSFLYEVKSKNGTKLETDELYEFLEWADGQGVEVNKMSDKNLANLIKAYNTPVQENDAVEEVEVVEDVEPTDTPATAYERILDLLTELTIDELKELSKEVKKAINNK